MLSGAGRAVAPAAALFEEVRTTVFDEVTTTLPVRPNDLDSLGHVNNATVLEYFEAGRWAWLEHHGLRRSGRIAPVVSRIEVEYRREILSGQVAVTTSIVEDPDHRDPEALSYRAMFHQTISLAGASGPAAEARVQVAFVDTQRRTLETVQEFLRQAAGPASPGPAREDDHG